MIYELPRDILIHGVFSTRKTSQALSASKDYPVAPAKPPFKDVVKITDCAIIAWDSQAALTLPHLGIDLSSDHVFNAVGRVSEINEELIPEPIITTINESRKFGVKLAKAGVKFFIHDTVSTKDTRIASYWTQLIDGDPKAKAGDTIKLYRNILKTHSMDLEFWQNLATFYGCYNIWLCHSSIKGQDAPSDKPDAKKATELQRASKGLLGAELSARITGQSWNYFYEQCRMVFYQTVESDYGTQQAMWTTRSSEFAVKPGLPESVLPSKCKADFRELYRLAKGEK